MKVPIKIIYLPLFVVLLLLQLYLTSFRVNALILLGALGFCLFLNASLSRKFINHAIPLAILLCLGFVGTLIYHYKIVDVIKDIFHFIKPLIAIFVSYIIFKKINNFHLFIKTIVIAAMISVLIHGFILAFLINSWGNIERIREFTKDNFLELFALMFLIYYKRFEGRNLFKPAYTRIFIVLLFVSCFLYFSRTMMIVAGLFVAAVHGYTKITTKTVKVAALFIVAVGLFYSYLYSINIPRDKAGISAFFYKVKMAPEEIFTGRVDRDNLAQVWDHWRGYEAKRALDLMKSKPESFVFGTGYGSLVNLKFYAPLTGEKKGIRYISELHNGYIYILYKTGIIGILVYLFMLGRMYGYVYKSLNFRNLLISTIGSIYLISTFTITGIYNTRDIFIFVLGGALAFMAPNTPARKHTEEQ